MGRDDVPMVKETEVERPEDKKAAEKLAAHMFAEDDTPLPVFVEDPVEKNAVLQRIMLNLDNFGSMFSFIHDKSHFVTSLHEKSLDDLKGILKTMENTRTIINLSNQMKQTFLMVGKGTEVLGARFLNLKTTGFVDNLVAQKQELDMIFRELAIEYAPRFTFQTRPELRLGMLYAMTLLQVDNTNRIKEFVETKASVEIPQATAQTYGDI
jgi:heterodisulfide reductase subunit A-like polyferredoxin